MNVAKWITEFFATKQKARLDQSKVPGSWKEVTNKQLAQLLELPTQGAKLHPYSILLNVNVRKLDKFVTADLLMAAVKIERFILTKPTQAGVTGVFIYEGKTYTISGPLNLKDKLFGDAELEPFRKIKRYQDREIPFPKE
jgi:hypothetical protein